jgi:hypothetical protein
MPSISVNLWDDNGTVIIATVTVICDARQAQQLEKMAETMHFRAHKLPSGIGRNMTFVQFKKYFLGQSSASPTKI